MPTGSQIIQAAEQYKGVPYSQSNPQSPSTGLDCSGIVQLALSNLGVSIPRTTSTQLAAAVAGTTGVDIGTNLSNAEPGDIIHYPGHEEIYLGNGRVFSEATYGTTAAERNMDPAPIIGIVRYSGSSGVGNVSLASDVTSSTDSSGMLSGITDWLDSKAAQIGLISLGAMLMIMGIIIAFKDTGVGKAAKTVTMMGAVA